MQESMRDELEAAAKKRDWTITEELLWRLRVSFVREGEERREPAIRALCYLVSQVAEWVPFRTSRLSPSWHRNRFMFRAFKLAITMVLDALEPPGKVESPFQPDHPLAEMHKTPESAADFAAMVVLQELFHPSQLTKDEKEWIEMRFPGMPTKQVLDEMDRSFYSMSRARRDLQIEAKINKTGG
jgi:hypothetical protein